MKNKIIEIHGLDEAVAKLKRKYMCRDIGIFGSLDELLEDYENALKIKEKISKISKVQPDMFNKNVYYASVNTLDAYFKLYDLLCKFPKIGFEMINLNHFTFD